MFQYLVDESGLLVCYSLKGVLHSVKCTNGQHAYYHRTGKFYFMIYEQPFKFMYQTSSGFSTFEHDFESNRCKRVKLWLDEFDSRRTTFTEYPDMTKLKSRQFNWF